MERCAQRYHIYMLQNVMEEAAVDSARASSEVGLRVIRARMSRHAACRPHDRRIRSMVVLAPARLVPMCRRGSSQRGRGLCRGAESGMVPLCAPVLSASGPRLSRRSLPPTSVCQCTPSLPRCWRASRFGERGLPPRPSPLRRARHSLERPRPILVSGKVWHDLTTSEIAITAVSCGGAHFGRKLGRCCTKP